MVVRTRLLIGLVLVIAVVLFALRQLGEKDRLNRPQEFHPERARTWHLSGWKLVNGKKKAWELWGQTDPAFFYERVGESVRTATNLSEDVSLSASEGTVPVTVYGGKRAPKNQLLLLEEWGQPPLDPETGLPTLYQVQEQSNEAPQAELTATYNQPLPDALFQPVPETANVLKKDAFVSVQAEVLAVDTEGNVRLRFTCTPGPAKTDSGVPLVTTGKISGLVPGRRSFDLPSGAVMVELSTLPPPRPSAGYGVVCKDEQGGHYRVFLIDIRRTRRVYQQDVTLIRIEPLAPGKPRPKVLDFEIQTKLRWSQQAHAIFRLDEVGTFLTRHQASLQKPITTFTPPKNITVTNPFDEANEKIYQGIHSQSQVIPFPAHCETIRCQHFLELLEQKTHAREQRAQLLAKAQEHLERALAKTPASQRSAVKTEQEHLSRLASESKS